MSVQEQSPSPALPASRLLPVNLSQPPSKLETTQITRTETEIVTYTYVRTLQKRDSTSVYVTPTSLDKAPVIKIQ